MFVDLRATECGKLRPQAVQFCVFSLLLALLGSRIYSITKGVAEEV